MPIIITHSARAFRIQTPVAIYDKTSRHNISLFTSKTAWYNGFITFASSLFHPGIVCHLRAGRGNRDEQSRLKLPATRYINFTSTANTIKESDYLIEPTLAHRPQLLYILWDIRDARLELLLCFAVISSFIMRALIFILSYFYSYIYTTMSASKHSSSCFC